MRWRDLFHLEWFPACCADDAERTSGQAPWNVEEDAAGGNTGILDRVAEIRDWDGEEIIVECADDCSRFWIECICRRPRGELRFSTVVAKDFQSVFGVSHKRSGWNIGGQGERERKREGQREGERTIFGSHREALCSVDGTTCRGGRC